MLDEHKFRAKATCVRYLEWDPSDWCQTISERAIDLLVAHGCFHVVPINNKQTFVGSAAAGRNGFLRLNQMTISQPLATIAKKSADVFIGFECEPTLSKVDKPL